ncbi:hypothetical protein [Halomonas caseinilytica]|uniref:hypothetical protein n=1 Tax=Halomonas caseinilytica TaxID=438744 RepID=UPI0007E563D2|nr:hypothetical protein [Halomonas caseinilytica]SEM97114.1 hypothetical protein SAMN04487952_108197 [Halomonas caseinilytica]
MVILQLKLCGLRIKRGWMHGCRNNPPLRTVDLLLIRLTILDSDGTGKLIEASRALCRDPAWLIENSEEIREA